MEDGSIYLIFMRWSIIYVTVQQTYITEHTKLLLVLYSYMEITLEGNDFIFWTLTSLYLHAYTVTDVEQY